VKDIVVRACTDKTGKPVAVENLDEVKSTLRTVIDRMVKAFEQKPQVAGFIRQMLEGFLVADEKAAVTALMEDLPVLAAGQNTGLKPGEAAREHRGGEPFRRRDEDIAGHPHQRTGRQGRHRAHHAQE
jgi:hypothetical protein